MHSEDNNKIPIHRLQTNQTENWRGARQTVKHVRQSADSISMFRFVIRSVELKPKWLFRFLATFWRFFQIQIAHQIILFESK